MSTKRRLIFINQHYLPDVAASGQYIAELAEFLATKDFEPVVICSKTGYNVESSLSSETLNGVLVYRVGGSGFGRNSVVGRLTDYLSYVVLLMVRLFSIKKRGDILICLTTPPLIGAIGALFSGKNNPLLHWVLDLHPEAETAVGFLKSGSTLHRFLKRLAYFAYKKASKIVVLGPAMKNLLLKEYQLSESAVTEIPIWSDSESFPEISIETARAKIWPSLQSFFVVNYSGNLGLVHDIEIFKSVITLLKYETDIHFTFSGAGPLRAPFEDFVTEKNFKNVHFMGYVPKEDVPYLVAQANVNWLSLQDKCSGVAIPSKTMSYLAANRPTMYIGSPQSDIALWLNQNNVPFAFENYASEDVAKTILELKSSAAKSQNAAEKGMLLHKKSFDRNFLLQQWVRVLNGL